MLLTIRLNHLRNAEFLQFFTDITSVCSTIDAEALGIKNQQAALQASINKLKAGFGKERGSALTAELTDMDTLRDKAISGIKAVAEAYTNHYDPEVVKAGERLLAKINSYGKNMAKMNYQSETSALTNLNDSLTTEAVLIAAIDKLHLTDWSAYLNTVNVQFNERFMDRIDEIAAKDDATFVALRDEVCDAYQLFCTHVEAHITLKGVETYKPLIDPLNTLIEKYNLILSRRAAETTPEIS